MSVMIPPCVPPKPMQNNDATRSHDLKRHAHDIAHDSYGIEDKIRAMVSAHMAPDDEDLGLEIGQLVC